MVFYCNIECNQVALSIFLSFIYFKLKLLLNIIEGHPFYFTLLRRLTDHGNKNITGPPERVLSHAARIERVFYMKLSHVLRGDMGYEDYLREVYNDPRHSGSLGGVEKLYRAVRL